MKTWKVKPTYCKNKEMKFHAYQTEENCPLIKQPMNTKKAVRKENIKKL